MGCIGILGCIGCIGILGCIGSLLSFISTLLSLSFISFISPLLSFNPPFFILSFAFLKTIGNAVDLGFLLILLFVFCSVFNFFGFFSLSLLSSFDSL